MRFVIFLCIDKKQISTPSRDSGANTQVCAWYLYYVLATHRAITWLSQFTTTTPHHYIFTFGSAIFCCCNRIFLLFLAFNSKFTHSSAIQQSSARDNVVRSLLRYSPLLPYSKRVQLWRSLLLLQSDLYALFCHTAEQ